jgi:hypothetical protein
MGPIEAAALLLALSRTAEPALVAPFAPGSPVGAAVAAEGLADAALAVTGLIQAIPREYPARGVLAATRQALADPWSLPEIAERLTPTAEEAAHPARCLARLAQRACTGRAGADDPHGTLRFLAPQRAIYALDFLLNEPALILRTALERLPAADIAPERVATVLREALASTDRSTARRDALVPTLAAGMALDRDALVRVLRQWDVEIEVGGDWENAEADEFPEALRGAVEGTVLTAQEVPELGWLVVGGPGPNRYDMSRIAGVFDPGGDDVYEWRGVVAGSRVVVDAAGNDTYTADGLGGPGAALLGASLIVDLAGDDRYVGRTLGVGAAAFGVGLVVDRAGNDTYVAESWSLGAALAGIGAVVDLAGDDLYDAPLSSQGFGAPSGLGALLDAAGNDRYRADRSTPSVYGTPATFTAFSQGCGFGYRAGGAAGAGGVGLLLDLAGDDRYECGEFGQGCGYFLGLGVLSDRGGNDLYIGNRYSQGTAAHQAFGVLVDGAGNDIYHGVTAANQGAAWDMSAAMLVDRAGDDHYRGGSLSQGAGAQQAIGVLADLAGDDRYEAGPASQGAADGNQYHWAVTRCPSLGVLWDAAGRNAFGPDRRDGLRLRTGTAEAPAGAEGRTQWGLFIAR